MRELGAFVEVVRAATKAARVDLVGYSQGGYYRCTTSTGSAAHRASTP
jgi:hypothetical protein